jgi:regulator of sirC expression with transglutaminase-like and TPR domain
MKPTICLLFIAAALLAGTAAWAQGGSAGVTARERGGAPHYIEGIEALEAGDYKRAVASLTRALTADGDNAAYHRARGVASTLAEDFPAAIADLQRAITLRPGDRETRLWLAVAYRMSGDAQKGAMHFTHGGDVPAGYANLVYNEMAMEYATSRYQGRVWDRQSSRSVPVREPVRRLFPDAGRAYAQRHQATGREPGEAIAARMRASLERGDCAAAMKDIQSLRRAAPEEPELRGAWASCLLAQGDALHARQEFTRTLNLMPLWPEGYLGRAQAAAMLGDERRALGDLEVTDALRPRSATAIREKVARLLASKPAADAVPRFAASTAAEAPWPALVDAALAVHRGVNGQRHRYDEAYQDRVRVLAEAIRDDAKSADRHEMLARFLFDHYQPPAVWNGPRGGGEPLRPQSAGERKQELVRALDLTDTALKLDARHAPAMATRGWILYTLGRAGEAEPLADRGLSIEPKNVRLLYLKAQLLGDAAAALAAQVAALRAGRSETSRERRSDGVYEVTRHYPPTAEQLARAAALEAEARALRQRADRLGNDAKQVESVVIPALIKDGDARLAARDAQGARRAFEQAYAYQPSGDALLSRLAEVFRQLGDGRRQRVFASLAEPMRHTTAANELKAAWGHAARTAWSSAAEALDQAAGIDPADARTPAYRSAVAAGRGDAMAARRERRAALALEEARARLMGTSFAGNGTPVDPHEPGLTLVLRLEEGTALLTSGESDRALEALAANPALEKRVPKERLVELLPSAMLPGPTPDSTAVPEAPSLASLLAWSRLGMARGLLATGRPADAEQEFRAIRASLSTWPATAKGRETMYVVDAWARLGLAEAAYAARNYEEAFRLLQSGEGWPWKLPEELEKQRRALSEKVVAARKGMDERGNVSVRRQQIQLLKREIERLQTQRDATQAELRNATIPESERRTLTGRLTTLERAIADRKASLSRLEQAPDEPEQPPPLRRRVPR